MVEITLPDGAKRQYEGSTSGMDIALSISPGLAKKALAITVNSQAWDLSREITEDSEVSIIVRDKGTDEALDIIRHDCAHVLAEAVQDTKDGPFADISFSDKEMYELKIAAWLHDCGKVATPEFVVDKSTKLETIYDRVNEVETRFGVLRRDEEIKRLKKELKIERDDSLSPQEKSDKIVNLKKAYRKKLRQLKEDLD